MIYQPKPIKCNKNNSLFADILIAVNVIFVYLNYQENKRNVEVTRDNVKISKDIAEHLKKINEDGIVSRLCKHIDRGEFYHGNSNEQSNNSVQAKQC